MSQAEIPKLSRHPTQRETETLKAHHLLEKSYAIRNMNIASLEAGGAFIFFAAGALSAIVWWPVTGAIVSFASLLVMYRAARDYQSQEKYKNEVESAYAQANPPLEKLAVLKRKRPFLFHIGRDVRPKPDWVTDRLNQS